MRNYNEQNGQPDLELEKFAINSLLSATHTSEMDDNDRDDIINKVNTAGNDDKDSENSDFNGSNDGSDNNNANDMGSDNEFGDFDQSNDNNDEEDLEEVQIFETEDLFLKEPVKCDMFQPGSFDALKKRTGKDLKESYKKSIFVKLHESLNQDENMKNSEPAEPEVKPIVKPDTAPVQPSRRNKPFLPMPEVEPDPKAVDESKWGDMMKGVKGEPASSWSLVAIQDNKVVGQDIDIKIQEAIPAHYEALKRQFPNAVIAVENGYGQIVWSDKNYKK